MNFTDLTKTGRRIVAPLAGFPAVRLTGTTIKQNLTDPGIQSKSLIELYNRSHPDVMFTMMDLTVEAEALGAPVRIPEDDNPSVTSHVVKSMRDISLLKVPASPAERMNVFIETLKYLRKSGVPTLGAYVIGPFTLASELIGAEKAALMTITEPDIVKAALDISTKVISMYAKYLEKAGADVIALLEPDAVYLSPAKFKEFSAPYVKKIIKSLDVPAVLHVCGDSSHLVADMVATGAVGLSLDADVDLAWAIEKVPQDVYIIGNISPNLMLEGVRDEIADACAALLKTMKPHKNFILSSGCDLPVDTPLDNIIAMISSVASDG